jgi:Adenylate and Guanylate cyclase catalytic domain
METSSRTLVCCVVFLDIAEYSRKPVSEQLQLKQAFNGILADAVAQVPPRDRIILDTGDGAALTFLGDPEDALFAAMSIRDSSGSLPVRIGVNLGPVRLLKDLNGQMNIIGDGINVAQRVMSFAQPGQLLVSRSFYEVVSRLSRDYARLFTHVGLRTDKHVREHEVYAVISGPTAARRVEETMSRVKRTQRAGGWFSVPGPAGFHRGALVAAPLVFLLFAGSGIALRGGMQGTSAPPATAEHSLPGSTPPVPKVAQEPAPAADAVNQAAAPPAGKQPPSAEPSQASSPAHKPPKAAAHSGKQRPIASTEPPRPTASPPSSGTIQLAISPWGEIVVDGTKRGVSPPLRELELPPGRHTIEIRNTTFPARVETVMVRSGESVQVRHRFR